MYLTLLKYGLPIAVILALGWAYGHTRYEAGLAHGKTLQDIAVAEQMESDKAICDKDKELTKEANDGLQKNITDITAKLNAAKQLHKGSCVPTTSGNMAVNTTSGAKHAGQNGISTDWLRDYGAECETYRSEVIILNNFGLKERQ